MNYRLISQYLGLMIGFFTLSMLTAVPFAMYYHEWHELLAMTEAFGIGMAVSVALYLVGRRAKGEIYRREALAIVGLSWLLAAAVGALPFFVSRMIPDFTAAYFESMSGLTTTGASVLSNVEGHGRTLLFWRSFLQFLGGLGIIVLFVAILPLMGVGGRALFKQEVPGPVPEGLTPRIKDTAVKLLRIYVALNVVQAILLMFAGMSFYDAVNHAMTTMATGGFSTKDASIAAFGSAAIEWIVIFFMFMAGTSFTLHLGATQGRFHHLRNTEFKTYVGIFMSSAVCLTAVLWLSDSFAVSNPGGLNFRDALFASLTAMTTTGFGTADFNQWPEAARILLLILMFVGGSAGSTAGAIKVIRWVILWKTAALDLASNVAPRRVHVIKVDGRPISSDVAREVLTFFFIWISVALGGVFLLALLMPGLDFLTILSAVVATLNNIGPGLESVGPTANYALMSAPAMWLLSLLMVLGRLELYAVMVLVSRAFWRAR